jgi:hypothetical protein
MEKKNEIRVNLEFMECLPQGVGMLEYWRVPE